MTSGLRWNVHEWRTEPTGANMAFRIDSEAGGEVDARGHYLAFGRALFRAETTSITINSKKRPDP